MRAGELVFETKPVTIDGCSYDLHTNESNHTVESLTTGNNNSFGLHKISYLYFSVLGSITTIVIAYILSLFIGLRDSAEVDSKLLAPCIRKYFPKNYEYPSQQKVSTTHEFNEINNQIN